MSRFTTRHGFSRRGDRTYSSWTSMRNRCNNPQNHAFDRYGGRGIKVCERWATFENFLSDMGECPPGMSIERKDNARGYEPGNCCWATAQEQAVNKRSTIHITINGRSQCAAAWAAENGIARKTLYQRLKSGWDPVMAATVPTMRGRAGIAHGRKFYETQAWAAQNVPVDEPVEAAEPA